ncbi:MAG: N-acetyltransferase [Roseitalea sp.]|jgi:phosphinothricin acetyltransferase|nr:N-acetyltransferase [Roseitalea sp.]MBO6721570.1 N-acetyltransferase [Roseitalea sp.]MBO6743326.1 N-acetyltransferase [Roseitalea sp.]
MTASFSLTDTTDADIPAITAIYADAVLNGTASFELDPPDATEMRRRFNAVRRAGYPHIVARDGSGALLGYAYASSYRTRPAYRWSVEDSVYVAPSAKGRGVGKTLLAEIIARCEASGFRQMVAIIGGSEHAASIGLHEALGFAHAGTLPATGFKHGRWLDSVLMQRPLGDGASTLPDPGTYPGTLYRPA